MGREVAILVPEDDKDELIYSLTDTLFVQQNFPEKRAFIPCAFNFAGTQISIIPSREIPRGQMVIV
jgi:hypothetical protein